MGTLSQRTVRSFEYASARALEAKNTVYDLSQDTTRARISSVLRSLYTGRLSPHGKGQRRYGAHGSELLHEQLFFFLLARAHAVADLAIGRSLCCWQSSVRKLFRGVKEAVGRR